MIPLGKVIPCSSRDTDVRVLDTCMLFVNDWHSFGKTVCYIPFKTAVVFPFLPDTGHLLRIFA